MISARTLAPKQKDESPQPLEGTMPPPPQPLEGTMPPPPQPLEGTMPPPPPAFGLRGLNALPEGEHGDVRFSAKITTESLAEE